MTLTHIKLSIIIQLLAVACSDTDSDTTSTDPQDTETIVSKDTASDSHTGDEDGGAPDAGLQPDRCEALSESYGTLFCAQQIADDDTWQRLTVLGLGTEAVALTKYVFSIANPGAIPLTFLNANLHPLHYDFLVEAYPEQLAGVTPAAYLRMAMDGANRTLLVGAVYEYLIDGERIFAFSILDDAADPLKVVTEVQAQALYAAMQAQFTLGEIVFVPETAPQQAAVKHWTGRIPILGGDPVDYEAYTVGAGFGTVRLMTVASLDDAVRTGGVGYQDILILDQAPADLAAIVSGAVTGTRQGILSHLNVRSAARGTPNCYIPEPHTALAEWDGMLVRLACEEETLDIREATIEEAEAGWAALKPEPVTLRAPDSSYDTLVPLTEVPTDTADERLAAVDRFGSKGTNLAVLYQRIDPALRYDGLVIPFRYYDQFMASNTFEAETADGTAILSFADALENWLSDETFTGDTAVRRERLTALQAAMADGAVDTTLIDAIETAVLEVFGTDTEMVRFRSSSNAEDALSFSGAGLYDSTKACLADELDGDAVGPSKCDADKSGEYAISDALRTVWASLWNPAAFDERAWYGIDQAQVKMGILVNTRTKGELADIVAFTGNPLTGGPEYLVNAQLGDWDVVSADPGIFPETTLLTMEDSAVSVIQRVTASSQTAAGQTVLTDAQLEALGAHLATIETIFALDAEPPADRLLFLDTEWKVTAEGALVVKQIRPFLY